MIELDLGNKIFDTASSQTKIQSNEVSFGVWMLQNNGESTKGNDLSVEMISNHSEPKDVGPLSQDWLGERLAGVGASSGIDTLTDIGKSAQGTQKVLAQNAEGKTLVNTSSSERLVTSRWTAIGTYKTQSVQAQEVASSFSFLPQFSPASIGNINEQNSITKSRTPGQLNQITGQSHGTFSGVSNVSQPSSGKFATENMKSNESVLAGHARQADIPLQKRAQISVYQGIRTLRIRDYFEANPMKYYVNLLDADQSLVDRLVLNGKTLWERK